MSSMPGDTRARDAYARFCMMLGEPDRWERLDAREVAAWEDMISVLWANATKAVTGTGGEVTGAGTYMALAVPSGAGAQGEPASAAAGVTGGPATATAQRARPRPSRRRSPPHS